MPYMTLFQIKENFSVFSLAQKAVLNVLSSADVYFRQEHGFNSSESGTGKNGFLSRHGFKKKHHVI